jgi:hypothetical protein
MSALRHPVVLTSLEEDFRRIGLIKEEGLPVSQGGEAGSGQQGHAPNSGADGSRFAAKGSTSSTQTTTKGGKHWGDGYRVGGDRLNSQSDDRKDPNHDYGTTEALAMREAEAFSEMFDEEFTSEPTTTDDDFVYLTQEDMGELETICAEDEELPPGIVEGPSSGDLAALFAEQDDDEDDEDDEDDDDEGGEDDDYEEKKSKKSVKEAKKAKKEDDDEDDEDDEEGEDDDYEERRTADDFLASLNERITALKESETKSNKESALPAFANLALISEMLADTFVAAAEHLEDEEYAEMAKGYADMAKYSAGVVSFLESEDDVDFEQVNKTFREFTDTVMTGVEAYNHLIETQDEGIFSSGSTEDPHKGKRHWKSGSSHEPNAHHGGGPGTNEGKKGKFPAFLKKKGMKEKGKGMGEY